MSDTTYDDLIVGALIGHGATADRWLRVRSKIHAEWLTGTHRYLFDVASTYFTMTGALVDHELWRDILKLDEVEPSRRMIVEQEFLRLWAIDVPEAHFRYAISEIKNTRRDEVFAATLVESLRAMTEGVKGGGRGYDHARPLLTEGLGDVDRYFSADSPEGNIRDDHRSVIEEYQEAKRTEGISPRSVKTGIDILDSTLVSLRPGENMLVAGYSGHGKTTLIQNVAWHAVTHQGKDVVVFTNENQYEQYRARVFNRHSHEIVQGGISMTSIKTGGLTPEQEEQWIRTCEDFGTNPNFGTLYVVQMSMGGSMGWLAPQLERFAEQLHPDLCVLDYIGRMGAITKRDKSRDEINDNLKAWKNALVSFDGGRGIAGITGYQISREAMREAQVRGYYTLDCLAETSEAERNADAVVTILRPEDIDREARLQIPKNRDGPPLEATPVPADFATTYIGSGAATSGGWL